MATLLMLGKCQGIRIIRQREKASVLCSQSDTIEYSQLQQHVSAPKPDNYLGLQLLQPIFEVMELSIEVQFMTLSTFYLLNLSSKNFSGFKFK